jgi:hypothetical protein
MLVSYFRAEMSQYQQMILPIYNREQKQQAQIISCWNLACFFMSELFRKPFVFSSKISKSKKQSAGTLATKVIISHPVCFAVESLSVCRPAGWTTGRLTKWIQR